MQAFNAYASPLLGQIILYRDSKPLWSPTLSSTGLLLQIPIVITCSLALCQFQILGIFVLAPCVAAYAEEADAAR